MNIKVVEERGGDALVLLPVDRLDSGNAHSFESIIMEFINSGERQVIVDFSRLEFISSAGLRVLLIAAKALKAQEGTLALCAMSDDIKQVFQISGFDRIIPVRASREAALEAAGATPVGGPLRGS